MRYAVPCHILELTLEVILDHKIGIKTMILVFSPGSCSKSLSLPRNQCRRERYVLGIVQGQDHDSLGIVIGQINTNSTPCGPSFVDPTLSLIISSFHFCYHNSYWVTAEICLSGLGQI